MRLVVVAEGELDEPAPAELPEVALVHLLLDAGVVRVRRAVPGSHAVVGDRAHRLELIAGRAVHLAGVVAGLAGRRGLEDVLLAASLGDRLERAAGLVVEDAEEAEELLKAELLRPEVLHVVEHRLEVLLVHLALEHRRGLLPEEQGGVVARVERLEVVVEPIREVLAAHQHVPALHLVARRARGRLGSAAHQRGIGLALLQPDGDVGRHRAQRRGGIDEGQQHHRIATPAREPELPEHLVGRAQPRVLVLELVLLHGGFRRFQIAGALPARPTRFLRAHDGSAVLRVDQEDAEVLSRVAQVRITSPGRAQGQADVPPLPLLGMLAADDPADEAARLVVLRAGAGSDLGGATVLLHHRKLAQLHRRAARRFGSVLAGAKVRDPDLLRAAGVPPRRGDGRLAVGRADSGLDAILRLPGNGGIGPDHPGRCIRPGSAKHAGMVREGGAREHVLLALQRQVLRRVCGNHAVRHPQPGQFCFASEYHGPVAGARPPGVFIPTNGQIDF